MPEETTCCTPMGCESQIKRSYIPSEEQKFSLGDRVHVFTDDGTKFIIVDNIQMGYDGTVRYNYHSSSKIHKCTQDEIDKYFRV